MWEVSDEALLAGTASGDVDALAALIRRHQRRVYGLALTIVRDQGTAEDVAQEAFARLWRHAAAYDPRRGPVGTWLLAITRHLAIDTARARPPEPLDPASIADLPLPAAGGEPGELAAAGEEASRLRAALAQLPPEQRRALVLAAFGGRSAREIAEAEGVPLGTAKTRIRAAMRKLRAALAPDREAE